MNVSTLEIRILVRGARSLKDKRRVVKSIKDRVRHQFNVSVAEVESQESLRLCVIGVALVNNDRQFADQVLNQVLRLVRRTAGAELASFELEL